MLTHTAVRRSLAQAPLLPTALGHLGALRQEWELTL